VDESYAPQSFFDQWNGRVLVMHGDQDFVVEKQFGLEIFERLQTPKKEFWLIEGGGHIDAFFLPGGNYRQKLLETISEL